MKVFLIGGNSVPSSDASFTSQQSLMMNSAANVGEAVCAAGHDLLVCSPFPDSADAKALIQSAKVIAR